MNPNPPGPPRKTPAKNPAGKGPTTPSGSEPRASVLPESLDAVAEFASSIGDDSVDEDDRWLHGSHPLVLLVQSALEAISSHELRTTIAGLNLGAKERIVAARKKLESAGKKEDLQRLLFMFEHICDLVHDAGYRAGRIVASRDFFEEAFTSWLKRLQTYAGAKGDRELADACANAFQEYEAIAADVVVESDE